MKSEKLMIVAQKTAEPASVILEWILTDEFMKQINEEVGKLLDREVEFPKDFTIDQYFRIKVFLKNSEIGS